MKDFKSRISSHVQGDDFRHWEFTRNTRLPRGTFDRERIGPDGWVFIICAGILTGLLAVFVGNWL